MPSAFLADFIAGWVGGVFSVVIGFPFDTIKVRQQNFSASLLIAARETYKYEGVLGFYKGMSFPLIAYGPSNSLFFGTTGFCMNLLNAKENRTTRDVNEKSWLKAFISGSVGGLVQATIMCPVEMIKITLQTSTDGRSPWVHNDNLLKFSSARDAFKTILKIRGVKGLFKGFIPMLYRDVPTNGLYFLVYKWLLPSHRSDTMWYHKIWAGGWAGIASISIVLPFDIVKTRMQADDIINPSYTGMTQSFKKIYVEEGIRIFWTGLPIITFRAFPANAMLFLGYEMTLDKLLGPSRN